MSTNSFSRSSLWRVTVTCKSYSPSSSFRPAGIGRTFFPRRWKLLGSKLSSVNRFCPSCATKTDRTQHKFHDILLQFAPGHRPIHVWTFNVSLVVQHPPCIVLPAPLSLLLEAGPLFGVCRVLVNVTVLLVDYLLQS